MIDMTMGVFLGVALLSFFCTGVICWLVYQTWKNSKNDRNPPTCKP